MSSKNVLKVKVRDMLSFVFEGEVDRITSYNEVGTFDVFPMHANFISIIRKAIYLYKNGQIIKEIKIEQAIMKVRQDVVNIYLGIEALTIDEDLLDDKNEAAHKPS